MLWRQPYWSPDPASRIKGIEAHQRYWTSLICSDWGFDWLIHRKWMFICVYPSSWRHAYLYFGKIQILCEQEFITELRWRSCQFYFFIFQYFSLFSHLYLVRCCWSCCSSPPASADRINLLICEASAYQDTWLYLPQFVLRLSSFRSMNK